MKITQLDGKNICIVGFAREGQAMQRALATYAPNAKITIADQDESLQITDATARLGKGYLHNLDDFDVIIRSSGVPNNSEFQHVVNKTTDGARIFFDSVAGSGVKIIGITGSKGKSTTSHLIYNALKAKNVNTYLMGNIGLPMIDFLDKAKHGSTFVIELSSYMLENLHRSPDIAVVTSFFPEHLDRHGSVANYWNAKKNIAQHQSKDGVVFYNALYEECKNIAYCSPGQSIPFIPADFPLPITETKLRGDHNLGNLAAAYKVAQFCGIDDKTALQALKNTDGLPYRINSVGVINGIEWIDDSLATAPEATLFALKALGKIDTLITGGMDRGGYNFKELGAYIAKSDINNIVLFPDTGAQIKAAIDAAAPAKAKNYFNTNDMFKAVEFAREHTRPGSACLLSSASPSYNLFKNHEEKSKIFQAAIFND